MLQENEDMDWWEATELSNSYSCMQTTLKQPEFWSVNYCKDTYLKKPQRTKQKTQNKQNHNQGRKVIFPSTLSSYQFLQLV